MAIVVAGIVGHFQMGKSNEADDKDAKKSRKAELGRA